MATTVEKTNHIIVGLGGTGGKVLRAFKMRMFEEFPTAEERRKPIALLYVDTTREMTGIGREDFNVMGQDASFTENEFLFIKGIDVKDILDNINNYPQLRGIVDNASAVRTAIGSLGEAAGQMRRAGRLLFAANANEYVNALKNAFSKCNETSHQNNKVVHIIAGLCGGTGSGAIIDAIAQARKTWSEAKILVYALMPEHDLPKADIDKGRYYQNGYAALRELNALQTGRLEVHDVTGDGKRMQLFSIEKKGVADGVTVYSNANENGLIVDSFEELPKIVGDYIYSRVFAINPEASGTEDIIRAFNFENMDSFALEYDETVPPSQLAGAELAPVRTKKVNSFGIKRVVYPEMRVLKHITYTTALSVLNQFEYGNWVENVGYVDEEENKDYLNTYLNEPSKQRWMLDLPHLTYEKKVLPLDKDEKSFHELWNGKVLDWAESCQQYDCPLTELHNAMNKMFEASFRNNVGVRTYYDNKKKALKDIVREIRRGVENEIFKKWLGGQVSITELKRASDVIFEYVSVDLKKLIDAAIEENDKQKQESTETLSAILKDWKDVGFFGKFVMKKKQDFYVEYQDALTSDLELQTKVVALEFAANLQVLLHREFLAMKDEVAEFGTLIDTAIKETKELVSKQKKQNAGLEDMKGAVVEVSEEESMVEFEQSLRIDKSTMQGISSSLREKMVPVEFVGFGDLLTRLTVPDIKAVFDTELSKKVKEKHNDLPKSETKVLGLSILSQLKQKLDTDKKIQEFAKELMEQSGVFLYLDKNQMRMTVNNNEPPVANQNIDLSEMFISIPAPDDPQLEVFARKLEQAFKDQSPQGRKKPLVSMGSARKNELLIITIKYCFPMRAISWLADYRKKYDYFLHSGNASTDLSRAILLHSEGLGKELPGIWAKTHAELEDYWQKQGVAAQQAATSPMGAAPQMGTAPAAPQTGSVPPPPPSMPTPPMPTPPPVAEPTVSLYLFIGGQKYGPYDYPTCKQYAKTGQLSAQTLVWEQGMAAWTPAGQVAKLAPLFAPAPPPVPPVPSMEPPMPPVEPPMPPAM